MPISRVGGGGGGGVGVKDPGPATPPPVGWQQLVVGDWWLAAVGGWQRSLKAVLSKGKKSGFLKDRPGAS